MKLPQKLALTSALILLSITVFAQKKDADAANETSEIFRVSNVGRSGVAENREILKDLYTQVAKDYDVELAEAMQEQQVAFAGKQVRILKVLDASDANGRLYLCAYAGKPSVFSIAGETFDAGSKTPPLNIEENGTHSTKSPVRSW